MSAVSFKAKGYKVDSDNISFKVFYEMLSTLKGSDYAQEKIVDEVLSQEEDGTVIYSFCIDIQSTAELDLIVSKKDIKMRKLGGIHIKDSSSFKSLEKNHSFMNALRERWECRDSYAYYLPVNFDMFLKSFDDRVKDQDMMMHIDIPISTIAWTEIADIDSEDDLYENGFLDWGESI